MRHQRRVARPGTLTCLLAAVALAACGGAYNFRPIQLEESATLTVAGDPLFRHVGLGRCTKAVTLNDVPARTLEVRPPPAPEFCLGFSVTSATLTLPVEELRALIAHGLAHLELGHATTTPVGSGSARARARGYVQARAHTPAEETEADRQAARLLTAAAGRSACAGLGTMLERVAAEGERWSDWTEQHPLAPARAAAARRLCAERR